MFRLYVILGLLCTVEIGAILNRREARKLRERWDFSEEYLHNLQAYFESNGRDIELYTWLIENSVKMQHELGPSGRIDYKPPAANHIVRNMQMVVNLVPELHGWLTEGRFFGAEQVDGLYRMLQEALIRHRGVLAEGLREKENEHVATSRAVTIGEFRYVCQKAEFRLWEEYKERLCEPGYC